MLNNSTKSFFKNLSSAGRNVLGWIVWFVGISLVLLHPLRWLFGDSLKPVRMISYITPWLLIFSVPMSILAGWRRQKWLSLVFAIATLTIALPFAPLFLPNQRVTLPADDFSLKVMSYNMHGIKEIKGIVEVIRQEKPDILLIQECSRALASPSFHGLDDLYSTLYTEVDPKGFGQAVFSRYPLEQISAEFDTGRTQKLQVKTPAGSIIIWNTHPIPPFVAPPARYDAQISTLAADISKAKGPLIVAGDLNATDQSEAYQKINRLLKNAHWEAGWGFGFSYPAPPYTFMDKPFLKGPLWRIDHIFYSPHFIATNAYTLTTSGGSDHFPIVAELSIVK